MGLFKNLGVIGAGQMGSGVAQVMAGSEFSVLLLDRSSEALDKALLGIEKNCARFVEKNKMSSEHKKKLIENIKTTTDINVLKNCDFILEAVTEDIELKLKIFKQLDEVCSPQTILCSNTSSISITQIAASTRRPKKVAGMHFMNPVPLMKLVEVIRGLQTSDETFKDITQLAQNLGKTSVESADRPGFVVNRILMPMINEAIYALYEGLALAPQIDEAMKLGTNQPMGPLALADFIGLDTCLAIMNVLYDGFKDSKYRPCPLIVKYVEAGWYGRKTGRGFYSY